MNKINPSDTINRALGQYIKRGVVYPSPLPADLKEWYLYTFDGGHGILCWLEENQSVISSRPDRAWRYCVPVPVKTVLREGYTIVDGCVVAHGITYDRLLGLITPEDDDEFEVSPPAPTQHTLFIANGEGYPSTIISTNYFTLRPAQAGLCYMSFNARTARLLVPHAVYHTVLKELGVTKYVVISFDGANYDLMFEDGSDAPYGIMIDARASDRLLPRDESGRTDIAFVAYGPDLTEIGRLPAKFRFVTRCPNRKPWDIDGSG